MLLGALAAGAAGTLPDCTPGVIGVVEIGAAPVCAGKVWIGAMPASWGTITVTPESPAGCDAALGAVLALAGRLALE